MSRFGMTLSVLILAAFVHAQNLPASDPTAIALAAKAMAALTGGNPLSDMTLNATVISILGSDYQTGTALLRAKGLAESRVDLTLGSSTRTDVRNITNGFPAGAWSQDGAKATPYAQHNCWTDAAWFVPGLGVLSQSSAANIVFSYIGLEQHNGVSTQHIRIVRVAGAMTDLATAQRLTAMDIYLDPSSYLPLAVAFNTHLDSDLNTNVPTETRFSSYQLVNGIEVPFHEQRLLNGSLLLDVTVTSAAFNTGLPDSLFSLQ